MISWLDSDYDDFWKGLGLSGHWQTHDFRVTLSAATRWVTPMAYVESTNVQTTENILLHFNENCHIEQFNLSGNPIIRIDMKKTIQRDALRAWNWN